MNHQIINQMIRKISVLAVTLGSLQAIAQTTVTSNQSNHINCSQNCLEGSHRGIRKTVSDKFEVDLTFRHIPGRAGSYLAVLTQEKSGKSKGSKAKLERMSIYRVDPIQANLYDMTPLAVTTDGGIIGVNNSDPSLALNVTGELYGKPTFTISGANSSNKDENAGSFDFDQKEKSLIDWAQLQGGRYKLEGTSDKEVVMSLSQEDAEYQSNASMTLPTLNGQFLVEQAQPGMHVLKVVSVLSTGLKPETYPKKIGVPLVIDGESYFVILNCSDKAITVLKRI